MESNDKLSEDEITKTLQIGRLAEYGTLVLKPYIKKVSENPDLGKLKVGKPFTQYISQVKRLYNVLNDEKELYEQGELYSGAVCFLNIINKNQDSMGITLDKILEGEEVFDAIIRNDNPQEILKKAKLTQSDLNKVYSYMRKRGIGAIVNKNE